LNSFDTGVLLRILTLARSGALDRALRLFHGEGLDDVVDDAAVLSVKGRLLKDRARLAQGEDRTHLWRESGEAYALAAELSGWPYHLINAATLSLLGGDAVLARSKASRVLEVLDSGQDISETAYYLFATRAEALLLLGLRDEAEAALRQAVQLAPSAWEDHATTRRQFRLILSLIGGDDDWLEVLRPPSSLHFAGPMTLIDTPELRDRVHSLLRATRTGFAFGALAGGSDIIIAEAVLDHGAELEIVLPFPPDQFRAMSVEPLGGTWAARFDNILSRSTLHPVQGSTIGAPCLAAVKIAAEVAMGRAIAHAQSLYDEAFQLILADETVGAPSGSITRWIEARWRRSMRPQHIVFAASPSDATVAAGASIADNGLLPAAVLAIAFDEALLGMGSLTQEVSDLRDRLERAIGDLFLLTPAIQVGRTVQVAFAEPDEAAEAARRISDICGERCRIGGHYSVAGWRPGLFGARVLTGPATIWPDRLLAAAPAGAAYVSEPFAMALRSVSPNVENHTVYGGDVSDTPEPMEAYRLDLTLR